MSTRPCPKLYCKSESKRYGKKLLTPLRLIARMNFSLKNYSCELLNLTGTGCESWNVSDKYTWGNAGDLWTRRSLTIIGVIKRQFFHMVTHVVDNSNLSQEIFGIDTWGAVKCSLGHDRKHMLTILPTIWRPGFKVC